MQATYFVIKKIIRNFIFLEKSKELKIIFLRTEYSTTTNIVLMIATCYCKTVLKNGASADFFVIIHITLLTPIEELS